MTTTRRQKKIHFIVETIIPALIILTLVIACVICSTKKYFWNDELYSYYLLADSSFLHMLKAFNDKINNTPPLYFILGWFWAKIWGTTELSLRLFSSLTIGLASILVWVTLRQTYNFWPTAVSVLSVFCTSSIILSQNAEARMYGLFLAACALGLFYYDYINRCSKYTWKTLFLNTLINAIIVNTHLYGLFYSGAILFAQIIRDRYFKQRKPKIYFCIILGWISLIFYIPSFLKQADAANPRDWMAIPTWVDLIDVTVFSSLSFKPINWVTMFYLFIILLLIGISLLEFFINHHQTKIEKLKSQSEISLLFFSYSFLLVPVFVWIFSTTVKPIFWDRYLIPSLLGRCILIAYIASRIIFAFVVEQKTRQKLFKKNRFILSLYRSLPLLIITAILLIQPIKYASDQPKKEIPGSNDEKYGYKELPIAMQFSHDFLERFHYSPNKERYFFILDWEVASAPTGGLFAPQEYKHLQAFKRQYYNIFTNHIIQNENFLKNHKRFLVLTFSNIEAKCGLEKTLKNGHCSRWFAMRIKNNPHYKITALGDVDYYRKLWLVELQL